MENNIVFYNDKDVLEKTKRDLHLHQVYQHFKGGLYITESIARCSESGKELVLYRSLTDGKLWSRPKNMFMDIKETENGFTFRFRLYGLI